MRLIIATLGEDAVFTLVPVTYDDLRLAEALGLKKPRNSLARSKDLRKLAKEYGLTDHVIGVVDIRRIVSSLLSDPGGRNEEFLRQVGLDSFELSEACQTEFEELANVAPRIVTGYTKVAKDSLDMSVTVDMRDDIAAGLAALPARVPGLGVDLGGLMSFGFSLDPLALRAFYEARLDAMEADPFECEVLGELQARVPEGRAALAKPIPPMVYSFRALRRGECGSARDDGRDDEP